MSPSPSATKALPSSAGNMRASSDCRPHVTPRGFWPGAKRLRWKLTEYEKPGRLAPTGAIRMKTQLLADPDLLGDLVLVAPMRDPGGLAVVLHMHVMRAMGVHDDRLGLRGCDRRGNRCQCDS